MIAGLPDPFDALLRLQRELEGRRTSEWLEDTTSGSGAYPPINVFQQGHDFVAIVELPGVGKSDLEIQAKEKEIGGVWRADQRPPAGNRKVRLDGHSARKDRSQWDQRRTAGRYSGSLHPKNRERQATSDQDRLNERGSGSLAMTPGQEMQVQEKRALQENQESTIPARAFVPATDI